MLMKTTMALRLGKLYDALVEAGASDGVAREASEEVAEYERRMHDIERKADAARGIAVDHERRRARDSRARLLVMRRVRSVERTTLVTAERAIRKHETMVLSRRDAEVFLDALLDPPRPSARLGKAIEEHRRRVLSR